jgi:bacterioferritin-associated ferredoxin
LKFLTYSFCGRPDGGRPQKGLVRVDVESYVQYRMYVCCCLGVNDKAIKAAVEAGATTVDAVTELTCAGSECGSCRPEIAELIEAELARGCSRRHLSMVPAGAGQPTVEQPSALASQEIAAASADQQSAA